MPSLTSCYFCGDAVGASLGEYAIPDDAPSEQQVSVTLCAGCQSKLTELLDALLETDEASVATGNEEREAPDADAGLTATDASAQLSAEGGATDDQVDGDSAAHEASVADDRSADDLDADAPDAEAPDGDELDPVAGETKPIFAADDDNLLDDDGPNAPSEDVDDRPFAAPDSSRDATDGPRGSPADGDREDDTGEKTANADAASTDPVVTTSAPEEAGPDGAAESPDSRSAGDAGNSAVATRQQASDTDGDTASDDGPLSDVSPRTYNRVVRLLQNREFPVDRADFEALATSAYELDHGECKAALDGAIEKGLLEERDGSLHRPE